jgi:hypothetical protein
MNQGELRVLRPLLVFFNLAAFSFSAVVREMAPMSSSLENRATLNLLIILYHAEKNARERERVSCQKLDTC